MNETLAQSAAPGIRQCLWPSWKRMLSNKGKYGLKALMYMARFDGPCLAAEIAAQNQIPRKFLDAILLELRNAGILSSKKGKGAAIGWRALPTGSLLAKSSESSTDRSRRLPARAVPPTANAPTVPMKTPAPYTI